MRTILVTAISGNVGTSVLKCFQDLECILLGCDINDYPAGYDRVNRFFKVPHAEEKGYIIFLLEKCKEYKVTHLMPINEVEIRVICDNLHLFRRIGVKVLINSFEFLKTCMDKYLVIQALKQVGIATPDTYVPEEFTEDGREYIIKLRYASGSKLVKRIQSKKQVTMFLLRNSEPLVVQEFISEKEGEFTVGVFSDGVQVRSIAFRRKLKDGYTQFVKLVDDKNIQDLAKRIAIGFDVKGNFNIQLRKRNGEYYVFEINPRLSGTAYFRHLLGFKDACWWVQLIDEKPVGEYNIRYQEAVGVREFNEKFLFLKDR